MWHLMEINLIFYFKRLFIMFVFCLFDKKHDIYASSLLLLNLKLSQIIVAKNKTDIGFNEDKYNILFKETSHIIPYIFLV